MKRKPLITIAILTFPAIFGRIIPEDGQKQWRWIIDASMPENSAAGQLVPHLSAYLFCDANPVIFTDPTGMSTRVVDNGDGIYGHRRFA